MAGRDDEITLNEIADNIRLARTFIDGLDLPTFESDTKTAYAVVRARNRLRSRTSHGTAPLTGNDMQVAECRPNGCAAGRSTVRTYQGDADD